MTCSDKRRRFMPSIPLRRVSIHGHDVSYRLAGDGPVMLLIHGMAGSSRTWKEVMPLLARSFTVIAPDLLGHGESAKPLGDYSLGAHASGLRDLLSALGIDRATIVGQSLGGGVAMQLAYQHPGIAERLVLAGAGGLGREVSWLVRLFTLPGTEYLMPLLCPAFVRDHGNALSRFLHDRGWRAPHLAEMWRAYASLAEPENRRAFVRTLRAVIDPGGQSVSARDRLYLAAGVPTLILWGDEDPITRGPRACRPRGHTGQSPRDLRRGRALPSRGGTGQICRGADRFRREHGGRVWRGRTRSE